MEQSGAVFREGAAEDAWRPHLLAFPYTIVDLGQIADTALSRMALPRFGLRLLKHVFVGTDPRTLLDEAAAAVDLTRFGGHLDA